MSPVLGAIITACSIIAGAAGVVSLVAAWWRHHSDKVTRRTDPTIPHRSDSRFDTELRRIGRELADEPAPRPLSLPVTGRASVNRVDQAAIDAHRADDTRPLQVPPANRDELLDQLRAGGWPRAHLRRKATPHHHSAGQHDRGR